MRRGYQYFNRLCRGVRGLGQIPYCHWFHVDRMRRIGTQSKPKPDADKRIGAGHGFRTFASVEPIPVGMFDRAFSVIALSYPFVDLFKIGLQSGCRYTKRETLTFYNDVFDYWEAHPDKTPRIYWKDSFVRASGIDRETLPGYCVPANWDLFNEKK